MAVGADWKKYGDDYSDWGVIQTKQSMGIDWRPRLYVEIDTWLSTSREVSVYGYPYGNSVMYESSGNLMGCSRVRVYSCDGFTYAGMSGGIVTDTYGRVVGIYIGTNVHDENRQIFVGLDKYLYAKLNTYN